ncbi:carbohydrate-binding family 9-like protein [Paenibacillus oryzisoli]|uniref:carbohydrate-binding family 9-like protein n=1 Tax=Paenibacillus oryzisoli TaxID=1850517 RepID=UPI003D2E150A
MSRSHYRVARLEPDCPDPWDRIQALSIAHYLWLDNGCTPEVSVKLYYTSERLYLQYTVYEDDPKIQYHAMNDPVCKDSCVEFFFQPLPESDPRYLNFELNAAGTLMLKIGHDRHDRTALPNATPGLFDIHAATGCFDPTSASSYWQLAFSIPFGWLQTIFPDFRIESGRKFRGNFYKCGDTTPTPHYGSWHRVTSPVPDFHRSCDFGDLELG